MVLALFSGLHFAIFFAENKQGITLACLAQNIIKGIKYVLQ